MAAHASFLACWHRRQRQRRQRWWLSSRQHKLSFDRDRREWWRLKDHGLDLFIWLQSLLFFLRWDGLRFAHDSRSKLSKVDDLGHAMLDDRVELGHHFRDSVDVFVQLHVLQGAPNQYKGHFEKQISVGGDVLRKAGYNPLLDRFIEPFDAV